MLSQTPAARGRAASWWLEGYQSPYPPAPPPLASDAPGPPWPPQCGAGSAGHPSPPQPPRRPSPVLRALGLAMPCTPWRRASRLPRDLCHKTRRRLHGTCFDYIRHAGTCRDHLCCKGQQRPCPQPAPSQSVPRAALSPSFRARASASSSARRDTCVSIADFCSAAVAAARVARVRATWDSAWSILSEGSAAQWFGRVGDAAAQPRRWALCPAFPVTACRPVQWWVRRRRRHQRSVSHRQEWFIPADSPCGCQLLGQCVPVLHCLIQRRPRLLQTRREVGSPGLTRGGG